MERSMKAHASTATSRSPNYGSLIKGLLICAGFLSFAYCISLITVCTPSAFHSPLPPNNATLLIGMQPHAATAPEDDDVDEGNRIELHATPEDDDVDEGNRLEFESRIKQVFEKASMPNRTVILTTLNEAWAKEGTMINLFLESFWVGYGTQRLLQHLIFICVDEKAYERCLVIHPHCLQIKTHNVNLSQEQILLSSNYIKLVWRRIKFLKTILEMNFDFIFTDTDVLWFHDPFPFLQKNTKADIQISSDQYNNRPWDMQNKPNTGFMYVRANEKTRNFFKYWYEERKRNSSLATQGIFNIIKLNETFKNIGMNMHFLDPRFFGGFCRIRDTDMSKAITMHATCCKGLGTKLIDLKMILERWKKWQQLHTLETTYPNFFKSKEPLNNQSILPPCNASRLDISPKFHVPVGCIKSLHKKNM